MSHAVAAPGFDKWGTFGMATSQQGANYFSYTWTNLVTWNEWTKLWGPLWALAIGSTGPGALVEPPLELRFK